MCILTFGIFRFTSPTSPNKRTPQATKQNGSSTLPLPDSHSMDWNSLVNTATKAINTDDDDTEDLENGAKSASKKSDKVQNKRYYLLVSKSFKKSRFVQFY